MIKKRHTAQDTVNEGGFLFGQPTTFEKSFPQIEDIKIKGIEEGYGVDQWINPRYFGKESIGQYINCRNPFCQRGGFEIGFDIWEMVRNKETYRKKDIFVEGMRVLLKEEELEEDVSIILKQKLT